VVADADGQPVAARLLRRTQDEVALTGAVPVAEPPADAARVGEHVRAELRARGDPVDGVRKAHVADEERADDHWAREVSGDVARGERHAVPARRHRAAVHVAEPARDPGRLLRPAPVAQLSVDVEDDVRRLAHAVANLQPLVEEVAVGREDVAARDPAQHFHAGRLRVDRDRVRQDDRPVLVREVDARFVDPVRDDCAGVVAPVPPATEAAAPDAIVGDDRTDHLVVVVLDAQREPIGLTEREADARFLRRATADR
jgi:hypothetical protein